MTMKKTPFDHRDSYFDMVSAVLPLLVKSEKVGFLSRVLSTAIATGVREAQDAGHALTAADIAIALGCSIASVVTYAGVEVARMPGPVEGAEAEHVAMLREFFIGALAFAEGAVDQNWEEISSTGTTKLAS
jgi:hypothetical protein